MIPFLQGAGLLASLPAAVLLRLGWRRRGRERLARSGAAAVMSTVAAALAVAALGLAAGLVTFLLTGGLAGLVVTFQGRERRTPRSLPERRAILPAAREPGHARRGWMRGAAAALLTLLGAEALCSAAAAVLPGSAASRFAALVALAPVLWAGLIVWTLGDRRLLRPILGIAGAIGASLLLVAAGLAA